jgi:hypothetical protein
MEENRSHKRVLYMNLETTRPRGSPRNRWQDEVREEGRIAGGEDWQEKKYNREEWKLLRMARNCRILHMQMERNGTEPNRTERNGTERNGTERNGAERSGTERNGTDRYETLRD